MRVRVLYFAALRDLAGRAAEEVELPSPARVADLRRAIVALHPELKEPLGRSLIAVNEEYAGDDQPLGGGEEIALVPPVSGG